MSRGETVARIQRAQATRRESRMSTNEFRLEGAPEPDDAVRVQRQAAALLEMFYSVHYRGNMALEDEMRGALTRKQAAILWLIRSEGGTAGGMRRKDIFRKLRDWFDISNPAVTKSLRRLI